MSGGAYYPQDAQVQPMLATAHLLRLARGLGATVHTGTTVTGFLRQGDTVTGVVTNSGTVSSSAVVNAAGTWGGAIAALADVNVPVLPRKGYVLVTEPLPVLVRHKVYAAEYVDNVASSDAGLQTSPVVEGTGGGTILIGSSRERVGFDKSFDSRVVAAMAAKAIALFPFLSQAKALRSYFGFRPYCPDHLPVIGADPRAPGLWHACGHEGAGIGLSVGTGALLAAGLAGEAPAMDLAPFTPERFDVPAAQEKLPMPEIEVTFDGAPVPARPGQTVGAALTAAGVTSWRTTAKNGRPRGLFCGIGVCFDCLITADGAPNQRACLTPVREGTARRNRGGGHP
ncbi:FAD-dependent oxidoreductase [Arthrobacter psychrolactophilus]